MPPKSQKKPKLGEEVHQGTVMIWAYSGSDLILLLYAHERRQFVRYCQTKSKSSCFVDQRLGTWFDIGYQNYAKCESRIFVKVAAKTATLIPTRTVNGTVQFSVAANSVHSNQFYNEFRYECCFGKFTISGKQGGGPAHLQIWCHLRDTAWWLDPIFDEVHRQPSAISTAPIYFQKPVVSSSSTAASQCSSPNGISFSSELFLSPSTFSCCSSNQSEIGEALSFVELDDNNKTSLGKDLIQLATPKKPENSMRLQIQRPLNSPKKHLQYPDDYEFSIGPNEEEKIKEEEEIKGKEDEKWRKKVNSESADEYEKFEDQTTMSVCSSKKSEYWDEEDNQCGLTDVVSIDGGDDDNDCGFSEIDDECRLTEIMADETETLKLGVDDDDDEDDRLTIGDLTIGDEREEKGDLEDFDDAATTVANSPTPTIQATTTRSNSPNLFWRPELMKPVKMDLSDFNRAFKWSVSMAGVVVERIRQPSTGKLICYKVSPFCTGDPMISELFLETDHVLQLGEWVEFDKKDSFYRQINPETFKPTAEMFRTVPCLKEVIMECEITIPPKRDNTIATKWSKWQTEMERRNFQSQARFIHRIFDDFKTVTDEHLGQDWWATLEYQRQEHWGERKGYWRILNIRPRCYGQWIEKKCANMVEDDDDNGQKPCSSTSKDK